MSRRPLHVRCLLLAALLAAGGCAAVIPQPDERHTVKAKYTDLAKRSFAVVVLAERMTQADFPQFIPQMTMRISERLREHCGSSEWVPPASLLELQYQNPRFGAMSHREIAEELGVDRLVVVDVHEFRLNEPGDQFQWNGLASGTVSVLEADRDPSLGTTFQEPFVIRYPSKEQALTRDSMDAAAIASILLSRTVDRCSWPFYAHDEKHTMDY